MGGSLPNYYKGVGMRYYLKQVICGSVEEELVYPSLRGAGVRLPRAKNHRPTGKKQAERNWRNQFEEIRRKINVNFGTDDLFLSLTFPKSKNISEEEAMKEWRRFVRRVQAFRKKHKLSKLKWIMVMEDDAGFLHLHAVMSGMSLDVVCALWTAGTCGLEHLNPDEDYSVLTNYISKEVKRVNKKRWCQSRGLDGPEVIRTEISRAEYMKLLSKHDKTGWNTVESERFATVIGDMRKTIRKKAGGLTAAQVKRRQAYARAKIKMGPPRKPSGKRCV